MFELKPINELVQIAAAGGGFRIKVNVKSTTDLVQIAAAGKGCVFFDEAVLT